MPRPAMSDLVPKQHLQQTDEDVGCAKRSARSLSIMTSEHERILWELGILNLTDSKGLSRAVYFYFCKSFGVYTRDALRDIMREQFHFGVDDLGKYVEFVDVEKPVFKFGDNNADNEFSPKQRQVRQYDDPNNNYSIYKIMSVYAAHIPTKGEFFRRPIAASSLFPEPIQFSSFPSGINSLGFCVPDMMKEAGFVGQFTAQSIKCAVVSLLYARSTGLELDDDLTRQRTRWWMPGKNKYRVTTPTTFVPRSHPGMKNTNREKQMLFISKLLDPPTFAVPTAVVHLPGSDGAQFQPGPSHSELFVRSMESGSRHELMGNDPSSSGQTQPHVSPVTLLTYREQMEHRTSRLIQMASVNESGYSDSADVSNDDCPPFKKAMVVSASPSSSSPSVHHVYADKSGGVHPAFIAMTGTMTDGPVIPVHISKPPVIKEEHVDDGEDKDCFIVESEASSSHTELRVGTISSTRQQSIIRNKMQCLTNSEMKELSSCPPKEGTATLGLAFKYSYEIDHNGEIAANREIRAIHTPAANRDRCTSTPVKRRLIPLNVVDSAGEDATERQEELPNFSVKLSDFFPSIGDPGKMDIRDVVIKGTRGQGTDRLNVELVMVEKTEDL